MSDGKKELNNLKPNTRMDSTTKRLEKYCRNVPYTMEEKREMRNMAAYFITKGETQ